MGNMTFRGFCVGVAMCFGFWLLINNRQQPTTGAAPDRGELFYSHAIATALGGQAEVRTPAGTRCDVVAGKWAIEVEWPNKWAESFGQAVHYSDELGLKPAVVLLRGKVPNDEGYVARLHAMGKRHGVVVWEYDIKKGVFNVGPD